MAYNDIRKSFISSNLTRAKGRKKPHAITVDVEYLFALGEKQDWKCNLSGLPLEFTRGGSFHGGKWINPRSCSIDRIDSTGHYTPGNVQLVCAAVNDLKSVYDVSQLVDFARLIVEKHDATVATGQLTIPGIEPSTETYSARGAARKLGKSRAFIHAAIKKGKLPATRAGRAFAIKQSDLSTLV